MSGTTVVDARLDKLERDNRRLKLTVGALLLVLAAVPLIGAVMPEQIQDAVFARAFYVMDENDVMRIGLAPLGIAYVDENGTRRARIGDEGIRYWDESENLVWSIEQQSRSAVESAVRSAIRGCLNGASVRNNTLYTRGGGRC